MSRPTPTGYDDLDAPRLAQFRVDERNEIALRFAIAFASAPDAPMYIPQPDGSWLEPAKREKGKSMTTIEVAFGWADAFIAARDGGGR